MLIRLPPLPPLHRKKGLEPEAVPVGRKEVYHFPIFPNDQIVVGKRVGMPVEFLAGISVSYMNFPGYDDFRHCR